MPYIPENIRQEFVDAALTDTPRVPLNAAELNFAFTILARAYLEALGETYHAYNDIIGALEGCKLEMYRRKTAPYEDRKLKQNGDVW